jgi:hypothetical protein
MYERTEILAVANAAIALNPSREEAAFFDSGQGDAGFRCCFAGLLLMYLAEFVR